MASQIAKDYLIISRNMDGDLVKAVREKMKEHWQPLGGPFVWRDFNDGTQVLSQAMILPSR